MKEFGLMLGLLSFVLISRKSSVIGRTLTPFVQSSIVVGPSAEVTVSARQESIRQYNNTRQDPGTKSFFEVTSYWRETISTTIKSHEYSFTIASSKQLLPALSVSLVSRSLLNDFIKSSLSTNMQPESFASRYPSLNVKNSVSSSHENSFAISSTPYNMLAAEIIPTTSQVNGLSKASATRDKAHFSTSQKEDKSLVSSQEAFIKSAFFDPRGVSKVFNPWTAQFTSSMSQGDSLYSAVVSKNETEMFTKKSVVLTNGLTTSSPASNIRKTAELKLLSQATSHSSFRKETYRHSVKTFDTKITSEAIREQFAGTSCISKTTTENRKNDPKVSLTSRPPSMKQHNVSLYLPVMTSPAVLNKISTNSMTTFTTPLPHMSVSIAKSSKVFSRSKTEFHTSSLEKKNSDIVRWSSISRQTSDGGGSDVSAHESVSSVVPKESHRSTELSDFAERSSYLTEGMQTAPFSQPKPSQQTYLVSTYLVKVVSGSVDIPQNAGKQTPLSSKQSAVLEENLSSSSLLQTKITMHSKYRSVSDASYYKHFSALMVPGSSHPPNFSTNDYRVRYSQFTKTSAVSNELVLPSSHVKDHPQITQIASSTHNIKYLVGVSSSRRLPATTPASASIVSMSSRSLFSIRKQSGTIYTDTWYRRSHLSSQSLTVSSQLVLSSPSTTTTTPSPLQLPSKLSSSLPSPLQLPSSLSAPPSPSFLPSLSPSSPTLSSSHSSTSPAPSPPPLQSTLPSPSLSSSSLSSLSLPHSPPSSSLLPLLTTRSPSPSSSVSSPSRQLPPFHSPSTSPSLSLLSMPSSSQPSSSLSSFSSSSTLLTTPSPFISASLLASSLSSSTSPSPSPSPLSTSLSPSSLPTPFSTTPLQSSSPSTSPLSTTSPSLSPSLALSSSRSSSSSSLSSLLPSPSTSPPWSSPSLSLSPPPLTSSSSSSPLSTTPSQYISSSLSRSSSSSQSLSPPPSPSSSPSSSSSSSSSTTSPSSSSSSSSTPSLLSTKTIFIERYSSVTGFYYEPSLFKSNMRSKVFLSSYQGSAVSTEEQLASSSWQTFSKTQQDKNSYARGIHRESVTKSYHATHQSNFWFSNSSVVSAKYVTPSSLPVMVRSKISRNISSFSTPLHKEPRASSSATADKSLLFSTQSSFAPRHQPHSISTERSTSSLDVHTYSRYQTPHTESLVLTLTYQPTPSTSESAHQVNFSSPQTSIVSTVSPSSQPKVSSHVLQKRSSTELNFPFTRPTLRTIITSVVYEENMKASSLDSIGSSPIREITSAMNVPQIPAPSIQLDTTVPPKDNMSTSSPPDVAGHLSTGQPTTSIAGVSNIKLLVIVATVPSIVLCIFFVAVMFFRRNRRRKNNFKYSIKLEYMDSLRSRCANSRLDLSLKEIHIDLEMPNLSNDRRDSVDCSRGTSLTGTQIRELQILSQECKENLEWISEVIARDMGTTMCPRQPVNHDSVYSIKEKGSYEPSAKIIRRESSKRGRETIKWRVPIKRRRDSGEFDQNDSVCTEDTTLTSEWKDEGEVDRGRSNGVGKSCKIKRTPSHLCEDRRGPMPSKNLGELQEQENDRKETELDDTRPSIDFNPKKEEKLHGKRSGKRFETL